jgi:hypothetical protein
MMLDMTVVADNLAVIDANLDSYCDPESKGTRDATS